MRATGAWLGLGVGLGAMALVGALLLSTPLIAHLVIYANRSFAQAIAARDGADPDSISGSVAPEVAILISGVGAVMIVASLVAMGMLVRHVCRSAPGPTLTGLPGPVRTN